jgi:predicted AAA+ superfamily ATPase
MNAPSTDRLFNRLDALLDRIDQLIPASASSNIKTSDKYQAYRWQDNALEGIAGFDRVDQSELLHLDRQKDLLTRNTTLFMQGKTANNALLWGARGTGKSSLIKAQLNTSR